MATEEEEERRIYTSDLYEAVRELKNMILEYSGEDDLLKYRRVADEVSRTITAKLKNLKRRVSPGRR